MARGEQQSFVPSFSVLGNRNQGKSHDEVEAAIDAEVFVVDTVIMRTKVRVSGESLLRGASLLCGESKVARAVSTRPRLFHDANIFYF